MSEPPRAILRQPGGNMARMIEIMLARRAAGSIRGRESP
jgi:hypothetical protein